jgi:protoporphyrinogen oxidase
MKIAIIGAGFTGLTAAYTLCKQGHTVSIFEKDTQPGGLAIGYKEKEWDWTLEAFYHHWFTNDDAVLQLAKELHYPVLIKRPKTSSYIDGKIYQLDSPLTLLQFTKLPLIDRLRMAIVLGFLRYNPFWKPLEKYKAAPILQKTMGKKAYEMLWGPLLVGKFGSYTKDISLAWFWARVSKRTTDLAYPEGGFLRFAQAIADAVSKKGGTIVYNATVEKIEETKEGITLGESYDTFDKVIVTLPSFAFIRLAPQLPEDYKKNLLQLKGLGADVLILRLKKSFFSDGTYWLNVCDEKAPVLAIVEHTNFMKSSHYNNEHIVYLGNYLPKEHPNFSLTAHQLLETFNPYLEKINPEYKKSLIDVKKFSVPFAQPIVPVNYSKMIPALQTPLKNVYLANMQQVYPWDRGTNYAVELGEKVAQVISTS